ncbi:hypothetical protein [Pseudomonas putida]|uniref:hypothetical protein n=1 Tax=Pseudomonas putida TaxID=303 RepID=UPI0012D4B4DE|nr:hypothetical protein [Pseudomonas putida]
MLEYLSEGYASQVYVCEQCGHEEPLKTYDLASDLQDYLAAYPDAPAQQHQGDAIGTLMRDYNEHIVFTPIGAPHIIDDMKVYTHADPGEVERLKAELVESDHAFVRIASEAEQLRAQLAERDALLRDIKNSHGVMLMTHPPQDPWLNNRIDERIRAALSVGGAPSQQELTEDNPNGQTEP